MEFKDPRIGSIFAGRYRLDAQLGAGGMGVVYRGVHIGSGRQVAIKFLHDSFATDPELVKRFQREVKALGRLRHPHVVGIVDSGLAGHVPFLVMEFLPGEALGRLLERELLPLPRALSIARQILAGVGHAHEQGVVHRDLKPDNILLVADTPGADYVKILDFGLAKLLHGSHAETKLTNTGSAFGTPGHMAPEQARGTATDERTDLYAIGVMVYEMVVGRCPFVAESPMAVLRMHIDEAPVPPRRAAPDRRVSPALDAVILQALEKDPAARFQDATSFARALEATPEGAASWLPRAEDIPFAEISLVEIVASETAAAGDHPADDKAALAPTWGQSYPPPRPDAFAGEAASHTALRIPRLRSRFPWGLVLFVVAVAGGAWAWTQLTTAQQDKMRRETVAAMRRADKAWHVFVGSKDKETPRSATTPSSREASERSRTRSEPRTAESTRTIRSPGETPGPAATASPAAAPAPAAPTAAPAPPGAPTGESDEDNDGDAPPTPPRDTPGARLEAASAAPAKARAPRVPPRIQDARRLLAAGKTEDAIQVAYQLRRANAGSADVALLLGHAYFRKVWRTDALREYDAALAARPALRRNPLLVRNVVVALDDPTYKLARAIVVRRLGVAALPELKQAWRENKNVKVRKRVALLIELIRGKRTKR